MKKIEEYKEGERITLVREGPGFQEMRSAFVEKITKSKDTLRVTLSGTDITANWIAISDHELKALNSAETVRRVFDSHADAKKFYSID